MKVEFVHFILHLLKQVLELHAFSIDQTNLCMVV
jgi:hypothetical protein